MDSPVNAVSYMRGKLKLFKTRQAIFLYVLMFYLMFMFLQRPTFVPGAEFSSNKESPSDPTIYFKKSRNWSKRKYQNITYMKDYEPST